jgi:hypothetical protein
MNEALSLSDSTGELALYTLMGMFGGRPDDGLDLKNLSADDAAEYLWRRFSSDLERYPAKEDAASATMSIAPGVGSNIPCSDPEFPCSALRYSLF